MKTAVSLALLLTGCDQLGRGNEDRSPSPGWGKVHTVERDVGRYQIVAASVGFTPMVIDTKTGCVQAILDPMEPKKSPVKLYDGSTDPACTTLTATDGPEAADSSVSGTTK